MEGRVVVVVSRSAPGVGLTSFASSLCLSMPGSVVVHADDPAHAVEVATWSIEATTHGVIVVVPQDAGTDAASFAALQEVVAEHRTSAPVLCMLVRTSVGEVGATDLLDDTSGFGVRRVFRRTHAANQTDPAACLWTQVLSSE